MPAGPLNVHVDLDVIDAAALPGLRYPAPLTRDTSATHSATTSKPGRS